MDNLTWHNPPPSHSHHAPTNIHTIRATPSSDFWRTTTETRNTGNFLHCSNVRGNFKVQCFLNGVWTHEYDQAGLMIRVQGEEKWVKAGIELMGGVQYVSAVVTNPYSDWSLTPSFHSTALSSEHMLFLELERKGPVILFRHGFARSTDGVAKEALRSGEETLTMFRKAVGFADGIEAVDVGIVVACPKNSEGVSVSIEGFRILQ
ncbi:hypothetical protein BC936DRAFT_140108 [Jimgerdemannia flammicorona]|uniref:Uncharacterized protein n=2 Tax=Jimgerdemannia flammicorona TaxID=994334 RepID=A0A433QT75_9FUNG|nr:hypothetical protein BC936DRAFT_140108 [Jimgerdemannia flammicorona]RUS32981.1 hypothetical protein BC938DRAFT_473617 [Jimgerdemannia flammicorona]